MKELLQGRPLKHPLHPMLVHFPIALFFLSFLLDVASLIWPGFGGFVAASFYSMGLGVLTGLIAAIPGFVDYTEIREGHRSKKIATTHMILNLAAIGAYGLNLGLRYSALNEQQTPWPPFILSAIGVGLFSISGYLGGMMVYDDGIAVGRHRHKESLPQHTIRLSSDSAQKEDNFVEVADTTSLKNDQTMRVKVDETIMMIAKSEGEFFAVQEFCTHRFGPLSEGKCEDGEIMCPWHRSCFDLRTGKVKNGPAKVDLKTFAVQVRDGKIFVEIPRKEPKPQLIAQPKRGHRRFMFGRPKRA